MAKEIEKKFLLKKGSSIPIPEGYSRFKIKQGYVFAEKDKQVRVRLIGKKSFVTIKFTDDIVRDEFEYSIPLSDGKEIYSKCELKIEKDRLSFNGDSEHYNIDSFSNGIVFIEVEFKSIKDMNKWVKPSWIGEEITGVEEYSNIYLAKTIV
jgi:CYTH domain-containing protein